MLWFCVAAFHLGNVLGVVGPWRPSWFAFWVQMDRCGVGVTFAVVLCRGFSSRQCAWCGRSMGAKFSALPQPIHSAWANPCCLSQSVLPEPIHSARAHPYCLSQSILPGPIHDARANPFCPNQSSLPEPIHSARPKPFCPNQSIPPQPNHSTRANPFWLSTCWCVFVIG